MRGGEYGKVKDMITEFKLKNPMGRSLFEM
jgi:hypothetical protein